MAGMVSRRCFLPVPSASLGSSQLGQVSWPPVSCEDVEQRPDGSSWSCVLGSSELPRRVLASRGAFGLILLAWLLDD